MANGPQPSRESPEDIDILGVIFKSLAVDAVTYDSDEDFMFCIPGAERLQDIGAMDADPGSLGVRLTELLAYEPQPPEPGASLEERRCSLNPVSAEGRL